MKKYDLAMAAVSCLYLALAVVVWILLGDVRERRDGRYLVEANEIMRKLEENGIYKEPDLTGMERIRAVTYLKTEDMGALGDSSSVRVFYQKTNGMDRYMEPLFIDGKLVGLVRFDYDQPQESGKYMIVAEGVILLSGIILLTIMIYLRFRLLKPFQRLSSMPYELSKGHLNTEIKEEKTKFFGRFVWGITMLRDHLRTARENERRLEKDKKLLLLAISHDIKTPLNSIKLYAKALREGVYETEEAKNRAAEHIAALTGEIESFVREIIKNSREDILHLEAENSEFYLKDYIERIRASYEPKCRLHMTELDIGKYENRLLCGNMDSAFEVMENLFENALKYGDGRKIWIDFREEDYCQLIRISNTGKPVPQEEMPHLFDSFYRGSNVGGREGNGLGLYICRELMRRMDGDIFAVREKDGMSFTLVFRLCIFC